MRSMVPLMPAVLVMLGLSSCRAAKTERLSVIVEGTSAPVAGLAASASDPAAGSSERTDVDTALSFEDFYNRVRAHAPDLEAKRSVARAAVARVVGAGAWMDPRLTAMLAPQSVGGMRTGYSLALSQGIPWGQRQDAERHRAWAEAEHAVAELQIAERHHMVAARKVYAEYWLNHNRRQIFAQEMDLLTAQISAAESDLGGGGMLMGVAEARAMRAEVARMLSMANRDIEAMGASMMRVMMGLPGDAMIPAPDALMDFDLDLIPSRADLLGLGRGRPEVAAARARLAAAEAGLRDAQANGLPEWEAMGEFSTMEEDRDMRFSLGIGVAIPVQRSPRNAEREASAHEVRAARALLAQALTEADHEVLVAEARLRDHAEAIRLLQREELPALAAAIAAAEAMHSGGTGSLVQVIDARRRYLGARQRLLFEQHEWFHWLGELECCIGMNTLNSGVVP